LVYAHRRIIAWPRPTVHIVCVLTPAKYVIKHLRESIGSMGTALLSGDTALDAVVVIGTGLWICLSYEVLWSTVLPTGELVITLGRGEGG